jgi:hypothetical protein
MATATARLTKKQRQELLDLWNNGNQEDVRARGYEVKTTTTNRIQVKKIVTPADKELKRELRQEKAMDRMRQEHLKERKAQEEEEDVAFIEDYDPKSYAKPSPQPKIPNKLAKMKQPPMTKEQKMLKSKAILEMVSGGTEPTPEPKPTHSTLAQAPKKATAKKTKPETDTYIVEDTKPNIL